MKGWHKKIRTTLITSSEPSSSPLLYCAVEDFVQNLGLPLFRVVWFIVCSWMKDSHIHLCTYTCTYYTETVPRSNTSFTHVHVHVTSFTHSFLFMQTNSFCLGTETIWILLLTTNTFSHRDSMSYGLANAHTWIRYHRMEKYGSKHS